MKNTKTFAFMLTTILFLTGCATQVPTTPHSQTNTNDFKKFNAPIDAARLYFLNGVTTGPVIITLRHGFSSMLLANGQEIGKVNKSDVLAVDIKPGNYEFSWRPIDDPNTTQSKSLSMSVSKGDILILRSNYNVGGTGFGLIGSLIAPPSYELISTRDQNGVADLNFIKETDCPKSICLGDK
jgi:hypothetical protein